MIRKISPVKFEHYKQLRRLTEGHQSIDIHTARELTSNMSRTLYSKTYLVTYYCNIGNLFQPPKRYLPFYSIMIEVNGFQFLDLILSLESME